MWKWDNCILIQRTLSAVNEVQARRPRLTAESISRAERKTNEKESTCRLLSRWWKMKMNVLSLPLSLAHAVGICYRFGSLSRLHVQAEHCNNNAFTHRKTQTNRIVTYSFRIYDTCRLILYKIHVDCVRLAESVSSILNVIAHNV